MSAYRYRVTFTHPGRIQCSVETFDDAGTMAARIVELSGHGWTAADVDQFAPEADPENVRFDYETGERIQYEDAADASEHHLRMIGG